MIELQINKLKGKIVGFSFHVENMIEKCIRGLIDKDTELLKSVIKEDEKQANKYDNNIEKYCIATLAQYAPRALNLRTVLMILKMNKDLERMADHCVNISYAGKDIIKLKNTLEQYTNKITPMVEEVKQMLHNSVTAFIEERSGLAKSVCKQDSVVNQYKDDMVKYFIEEMKKDPSSIEIYFHFIQISKNLERIADLSTNISEDIVFAFKGKVIKH